MRPSYIEVRLKTGVDSGDLYAALEDDGIIGAWEENGLVRLYWIESRWRPDLVEKIRVVLARLAPGSAKAEIDLESIPDRDWNSLWAQSIQPIRIGRRVWVRQSWNSARPPHGSIVITLDPRRAFGTGYHPTTQLMIEALESENLEGKRVLDVGTGSGILSMVSVRLGARSALGIDVDPEAIECARGYAATNGFGPELCFNRGSASEKRRQRFDVVLANIDRNTILESAAALRLSLAPKGILWISGLLLDDEKEIMAVFSRSGLISSSRSDREGWVALRLSPSGKGGG